MSYAFRILSISYVVMACGAFPGQKRSGEPIEPVPRPVASPTRSTGTANTSGEKLLDGQSLYEQLCTSCHGILDRSTVARASVDSIQSALQSIPNMQSLPELKSDQVIALADALSKTPSGKTRGKSGT